MTHQSVAQKVSNQLISLTSREGQAEDFVICYDTTVSNQLISLTSRESPD
jgi:hypothetical protein